MHLVSSSSARRKRQGSRWVKKEKFSDGMWTMAKKRKKKFNWGGSVYLLKTWDFEWHEKSEKNFRRQRESIKNENNKIY